MNLTNWHTCLYFWSGFFSRIFLSPCFLNVKGTPYLAAGFVIFWAGETEAKLCPEAGLFATWKDTKNFYSSSSPIKSLTKKFFNLALFHSYNHWQDLGLFNMIHLLFFMVFILVRRMYAHVDCRLGLGVSRNRGKWRRQLPLVSFFLSI